MVATTSFVPKPERTELQYAVYSGQLKISTIAATGPALPQAGFADRRLAGSCYLA